GEATVVTTDAQGRQVVTSLPFYVSNTLLARGLSDFDLSVGRLRDDYGLRNFSYADNAASGIYRYGVSDRLTLSTHAEAARLRVPKVATAMSPPMPSRRRSL
ncbi:hypothetical protein ACV34R_30820, partial [Pseudomonas aeruginosa]